MKDTEVSYSHVGPGAANTQLNALTSQKDMHNQITVIEKQNLKVVDLLKQVKITTNEIKVSGAYANEKVAGELFGNNRHN